MIPLYHNKDWLYDQYWNQEKSLREIGEECESSISIIRRWMKRFNIKRRSVSEATKIALYKPEINKKLRKSLKGKKKTQKHRENISKSKKLDKNPNWKGIKAKSHSLHKWLRENHKKPEECENCGKKKRLYLTFNHKLGEYTRNIEDYEWLCCSCHLKKDYRNGRKRRGS